MPTKLNHKRSVQKTSNADSTLFRQQQRLYEEKERAYTEAQNKDGLFFQLLGNSAVVLFVIGLSAFICIIGIIKAFNNIVEEEEKPPEQVAVAQQPAPPDPNQKSEAQMKQEKEQEEAEANRELKELEANFKPFENMPDTPPVTDPMMTNPSIINSPSIPTPSHVEPPIPVETPPVDVPIQEPNSSYISPSVPSYQPEPSIPTTPPVTDYSQPSEPSVAEQVVEPELKGIARGADGEVFCYIYDGKSTSRYREGSVVNGFTIDTIGDNYVILSKDGDRHIINIQSSQGSSSSSSSDNVIYSPPPSSSGHSRRRSGNTPPYYDGGRVYDGGR